MLASAASARDTACDGAAAGAAIGDGGPAESADGAAASGADRDRSCDDHLRFVLAWAELHQDELLESWRRARAGETLQAIEPLQ